MTTWKRHEREVAAIVGGKREPNTGEPHEDVSHPLFSFQVKHRRKFPIWFRVALNQARNDAKEKIPVAVFAVSKQGIKTQRFFVLDEQAWLDLHG